MKIEVLTIKQTITKHTIKLGREHILSLVAKKIPKGVRVITVQFQVPTGGDYSGELIDIDSQDCVWVQWEEHTTEDSREL